MSLFSGRNLVFHHAMLSFFMKNEGNSIKCFGSDAFLSD